MSRLTLATSLCLLAWPALAQQGIGQIPAWNVVGNPSASQAPPRDATISALFDGGLCNTVAAILQRGASTWGCAAPSPGLVGSIPSLNVIGNATGSAAAPTAFPIFSTANTWTAAQTATAGLTLTGQGLGIATAANSLNGAFFVTQTYAGSASSTLSINTIQVTGDQAAVTGATSELAAVGIRHSFGGGNFNGARAAFSASAELTAQPVVGATNQFYVGAALGVQADVNARGTGTGANAKGAIQALITQTTLAAAATNYIASEGLEVDLLHQAGSSADIKVGVSVASSSGDAVQGLVHDAAFMVGAIGAAGGAVGFKNGYMISDMNGSNGLSATGTVLGLKYATPYTIGYGVDLLSQGAGAVTITNYAFRSLNFNVDGAGRGVFGFNGAAIAGSPLTIQVAAGENLGFFNVNGGPQIAGINNAGNAFMPLTLNGFALFLQGNGVNALSINNAQVINLPVVTTGTPAASLCLDGGGNIIKKTTAGACI